MRENASCKSPIAAARATLSRQYKSTAKSALKRRVFDARAVAMYVKKTAGQRRGRTNLLRNRIQAAAFLGSIVLGLWADKLRLLPP